MSDLCQACGHDATAHSFGQGDCGWTGGSRTALCPCRQFTRDDRGRPAGKSQGAAMSELNKRQNDTADRDDLDAILAKHEGWKPSTKGLLVIECDPCGHLMGIGPESIDPNEAHRAHVAQMVLESDWLADRDRANWNEGHAMCCDDTDCGGTYDGTPHRADHADNTTDRT